MQRAGGGWQAQEGMVWASYSSKIKAKSTLMFWGNITQSPSQSIYSLKLTIKVVATNSINGIYNQMQDMIANQQQYYYQTTDSSQQLIGGNISTTQTMPNGYIQIMPQDFSGFTWVSRVSDEPNEGEKAMAAEEIKGITKSATAMAVKEDNGADAKVALLKDLGFDKLHKAVAGVAERAMRENLIAARGYTKITKAVFDKAYSRIQEKSRGGLRLELTPVAKYLGQHNDGGTMALSLPPTDVLEKMAVAKKEELFDSFGIIHVCKVQDPILVGQIKGSNDMYFVAEWGDDITLEQLMA